ncbi:uncharacterized protein [Triticum aestivum]|uniref:uncharacterized protein n=1 Tax=Triticum aestivum TaxID=4565 RepID=UPI001ABC09E0|nr:uncharacterized protein LOC120974652 [Aegilops tauschii subsp. strangulata]XP_044328551.1 uncharacterized protein LOC123049731 [Triticum aestivum]
MAIPGATTPALASGSTGATTDSAVREVAYVLGAAGPAVADSVVGVDSPEMRLLDQGRALLGQVGALSDIEFSGAFSSRGGGVASAGAGDGARTVDSCAIQSFRPGAPTAANTTFRPAFIFKLNDEQIQKTGSSMDRVFSAT